MSIENCANHSEHSAKISRIEVKIEELEKRVYEVEKKHDVKDERFKRIDEKLEEIISIIKVSQSRIPNTMWGIGGSVAGGVLMWLVLEFLKR